LLTQITTKACLLEPFRKQPSKVEIRQCLLKLFALHGELIRQVKQAQRVFVKSRLKSLFCKIDKVLSPVVEPLVQLPLEESARILPRLSREELLARFGKKS